MIFNWWKQRRRRKLLAAPFPDHWDQILQSNVLHVQRLLPEQQQRLRRLLQIFVAEKNWEGCGGLTVTEEMQVTIAAQACLLVVGMPDDILFEHVLSILVYPTAYVATETRTSRAGLVIVGGQPRLGEAWWQGPVILSWEDALSGGQLETPGHNLVLHEFAHQLDMMNGHICDGTPALLTADEFRQWVAVLEPEYQRLVSRCHRGQHGIIDCYGATSPAEFFAVVTETFFERPHIFRMQHSAAYDILRKFYQLDPVTWQRSDTRE